MGRKYATIRPVSGAAVPQIPESGGCGFRNIPETENCGFPALFGRGVAILRFPAPFFKGETNQ